MIGAAMRLSRLETLRAAGHVERFHNEPARIRQTNAEHTWHVMTLVLMLEPEPSAALLIHTHYHDFGEIFTGDFPAPLKWEYPELRATLKRAEERGLRAVGIELPELTNAERVLLKFCDGAELCLTSIEHVARGNHLAMRPFRLVMPRLHDMIEQHPSLHTNAVSNLMETLSDFEEQYA